MHRQPQHGRVERRAIIAISKLMSTRCSGKGFCSLHVSTWSASCCTWIDFVSSSLARVSCSSSSCQSALRRSCHTRFLCRTLKLVSRSNACINSSTKHQVRTHQCINLTIFLPACLAKWFFLRNVYDGTPTVPVCIVPHWYHQHAVLLGSPCLAD